MTPAIHWKAASYYASIDRIPQAEEQLRKVLALSWIYGPPAWGLCRTLHLDPQTVLSTVMPQSKPADLMVGYAEFLAAQGFFDAAARVWAQTINGGQRVPYPVAQSYLSELLKTKQFDLAWKAWKDLEARRSVEMAKSDVPGNLVFNGGFETPPLDGGFDWTYGSEAYLSLDFSDSGAYRGARCLRLDFTVSRNDDYEPLYQYISVVPDSYYSLDAYARSADITSDSGPRMRVIDPLDPRRLDVSSDKTVGTTPWHPIHVTFTTGPGTDFIRLSVWRPRSRSFPTEISGTFWLDQVTLRLSAEPPSHS